MTDLERVAQLWCLPEHGNKEMDAAFAESVLALVAAVRVEASEAMRERCAKVADGISNQHRADADTAAERDQPMKWSDSDGASLAAENVAAAIRALSVAEPKEDDHARRP
jgi:hypothetical protein